jgi:uncharacterized protein (TIGR03382 family)
VRLAATDGAGQTTEVTCSLPVAVPDEPKPDPEPPVTIDASSEPTADTAEPEPDAGDTAEQPDEIAGAPEASSSGCGAAPGGGFAPWTLLLAALAIAARRRRAR